MFTLLYEGNISDIFCSPYILNLIDNMKRAINGSIGAKKLSVFSGHDSDVVPFMIYYNLTSSDCLKKQWNNQTVNGNCAVPIPYASSIFF